MVDINTFKKKYTKAIQNGDAAIFAGAGLSIPSGYVNWKELLNNLATEIGLDVEKEPDLIEVAQYYCNEKRNRNEINQTILNKFYKNTQPSESLDILSDLPIDVYWTTNYDQLIENVLHKNGKSVDVKITPENLATNLQSRDAVVYKMHGDISDLSNCVIIKDDYEMYNDRRRLFTTALQGDLVSKTFLFIGFSFEDPNLKYILSRIRILLGENVRTHYLFLKKINKKEYKGRLKQYNYDLNKQNLKIEDLMRYGIETVMLDDYNEIPTILNDIKKLTKLNNIFISGSAHEYGEVWKQKAPLFIKKLVASLCKQNYNIITGNARGIGSFVISSVIESCQSNVNKLQKQLTIKAFPYEDSARTDYTKLIHEYREGIYKQAGIVIFMFGNKLSNDNKTVSARGVYEEYKMALQSKTYIIPIGSTGYVAQEIWEEVEKDINQFPYLKKWAHILKQSVNPDEIIKAILNILDTLQSNI